MTTTQREPGGPFDQERYLNEEPGSIDFGKPQSDQPNKDADKEKDEVEKNRPVPRPGLRDDAEKPANVIENESKQAREISRENKAVG